MNIKVKVALIGAIAVIISALVNGAFILFKSNTNEKPQIVNSNRTIVIKEGNLINNFDVPQELFDKWAQPLINKLNKQDLKLNEQDLLIKQFKTECQELANKYANLKSTLEDRTASDTISKRTLHQLTQGKLDVAVDILIQDIEDQKQSGNYQMASNRLLDLSQLKYLQQEPLQGSDYTEQAKDLQRKHENISVDKTHNNLTEQDSMNGSTSIPSNNSFGNTDTSAVQNPKGGTNNYVDSSVLVKNVQKKNKNNKLYPGTTGGSYYPETWIDNDKHVQKKSNFKKVEEQFSVEGDTAVAVEFLKISVNKVIAVLSNKTLSMYQKKREVLEITNTVFSFSLMAKLSIGKNYWLQFNTAQREEFISLFAELNQGFYIDRLVLFDDEEVIFQPATESNRKKVQVPTILLSNGKEYSVSYKMANLKNGWKVYDIIIEGCSMIHTYRAQYQHILKGGEVEDLLTKMREKKKGI